MAATGQRSPGASAVDGVGPAGRRAQVSAGLAFVVLALGLLFWAKYLPYSVKVPTVLATHSVGGSILTGDGALGHGPSLVAGWQFTYRHDRARPKAIDASYLDTVRQSALVLLYRLLFVVYAEDRDLLPDRQEPYKTYSLTAMRRDIADGKAKSQTFSSTIATYWPKLTAVFKAIAEGDDDLGIPPYNGGLFAKDSAPLLDRVTPPTRLWRISSSNSRTAARTVAKAVTSTTGTLRCSSSAPSTSERWNMGCVTTRAPMPSSSMPTTPRAINPAATTPQTALSLSSSIKPLDPLSKSAFRPSAPRPPNLPRTTGRKTPASRFCKASTLPLPFSNCASATRPWGRGTSWSISLTGSQFRTIAPSEDLEADYDLKWLDAVIEEAVTRHDCRGVLVDPWNEIEHLWGKQDTEATYLNRALKHLKRLARRFQIFVVIVAHPTAAGGRVASIDEANLYDINGGAVWNNKADVGVIVWADDVALPERHIRVAKSKDYQRMGRPGIVRMRFAPERASFDFVGAGK